MLKIKRHGAEAPSGLFTAPAKIGFAPPAESSRPLKRIFSGREDWGFQWKDSVYEVLTLYNRIVLKKTSFSNIYSK